MLAITLLGTFSLSFGALVGVPLVALAAGALGGVAVSHSSAALAYGIACVVVGVTSEGVAIQLEADDGPILAQAAALLLFGRALGPLAGAAAWDQAVGRGFCARPFVRVLLARAARLAGVLGVLVIAPLAPTP